MMIKHSWKSAKNTIESFIKAGQIDALSCDVFDTLLIRKTTPLFIEDSTCNFVANETKIDLGIVKEARERSWEMVSAFSVTQGYDAEAKVQAHFQAWITMLVAGSETFSEENIKKLIDDTLEYELKAEKPSLKPNPHMMEALKIAKASGLKTIAVSDMYLPSPEITRLLNGHGFEGLLDKVISSADYGLQKKTGRLFATLLKENVLPNKSPRRILHVGDDTKADGIMAEKHGLRSLVVYDTKEMVAQNKIRFTSKLSRAHEISSTVLSHDLSYGSLPEWVGATHFGPIYSAFIQKVAEEAKADGMASVWFLAREGWLLHELYETVRQSGLVKSAPPSGYLYASRLSTMRAQLKGYGKNELIGAMNNTPDRRLVNLLSPLKLPQETVAAIFQETGLDKNGAPSDENLEKLASSKILRELTETIGRDELAGLKAYLERTKFPKSKKAALVDVGWGGQIQENFEKALRLLGIGTEITGYYLGTDHRAEERRAKGLKLKSVLINSKDGGAPGVGAFSFVQGLELVTRSQHGSVIGYALDGTPRLDNESEGRKAEEVDDPVIAQMQIGILNYARRYFELAATAGLTADSSVSLGRDVMDIVSMFPPKAVAATMLNFNNIANLGMDEGLRLGGKDSIFRPRKLRKTLKQTLWQEGTVAYALPFIGPLALLAYRKKKGMIRKSNGVKTSIQSVANSELQYDEIVPDVLEQNLTEKRKAFALEKDKVCNPKKANPLSLRDLMLIHASHRVHGHDTKENKSAILAHLKGYARYIWKHPVFVTGRHRLAQLKK